MEGLNNINEIVSLEINQIEIIDMLESINNNIVDFKNVIVLLFGFIVGYMILRDFLSNIFNH